MASVVYCQKGHYIGIQNQVRQARSWGQFQAMQGRAGAPKDLPPFCATCGAPSINACPHCQSLIEVEYPGGRPSYCARCGKALPWTDAALAAAREYTDELEQLTQDEKAVLKGTFDDLVCDTDRTPLAVSRFRRLVDRVGPLAGGVLKKIVETVATEAAKKALGL
jgi:hypothetical protein